MTTTLEHANLLVLNMDDTLTFLQTALPDWKIRGRGPTEEGGEWLHFGGDFEYIAIYDQGADKPADWDSDVSGVKHLGFVVDSIDQLVQRMQDAGYQIDHWGGRNAHRNSIYFVDRNNLEYEFVEYTSDVADDRNTYL